MWQESCAAFILWFQTQHESVGQMTSSWASLQRKFNSFYFCTSVILGILAFADDPWTAVALATPAKSVASTMLRARMCTVLLWSSHITPLSWESGGCGKYTTALKASKKLRWLWIRYYNFFFNCAKKVVFHYANYFPTIKKWGSPSSFLSYCRLKLKLGVFLTGLSVAMKI